MAFLIMALITVVLVGGAVLIRLRPTTNSSTRSSGDKKEKSIQWLKKYWVWILGAVLIAIFYYQVKGAFNDWLEVRRLESERPIVTTKAEPRVVTKLVMATRSGSPKVSIPVGAFLLAPKRDETYKVGFKLPNGRDTIVVRPQGEILNLPGSIDELTLYSVVSKSLEFEVKLYPTR